MRSRRTVHALVMISTAGLSAALLAACGGSDATDAAAAISAPTGSYPVSVTSCGKSYEYQKAPTRVVLGYSGVLRNLTALGVQKKAYGYVLGSYDKLPADYPSSLKEVSPDYTPSRESMLAAKPDLFLGNDEGQVTGEGTVSYDDLSSMGANTYILGGYCKDGPAPRSIDVIYDDVTALGKIYGVPDEANQVVTRLKARVAKAKAVGGGRNLRIAYVQVYDGKLYANSGYPASGVIEALGLTNEFADLKENFAVISTEQALARKPDALIVMYAGEESPQAATDAVKKLLSGTPAVRAGHVYAASDTDFQAGGVAVIDHLERVAAQVFPG